MNLSRVNLNLLIALDALLTEKNVTKAGEKIFITQSAMSVALRQLRELFEDELLIRNGNTLEWSPLARELAPRIKKTIEQIEKLIHRKSFDPLVSERTFTLGLTEYSAFVLLPSLYAYLKTHGPLIKLQIRQMPLYGGKKLTENNEVDLAVGIRSESSELETESLFNHSLVCAARKNHPFMKSPLTLDTYLKANHLCLSKDKNCPHMTDIVLSNMGVSRKIVLQVPYIVPALHVLANSDLLMTFPKEIIQKSNQFLPLTMQDLPFQLSPVSYVQMWHLSHNDDEGHRWLRQAIKLALK